MKRAVTAAAVALLLLTGCGTADGDDPSKRGGAGGVYEVIHVDVDGRKVPCIVFDDDSAAAALSCDWARNPACEADDRSEGAPKC